VSVFFVSEGGDFGVVVVENGEKGKERERERKEKRGKRESRQQQHRETKKSAFILSFRFRFIGERER
jgi:hypothetical protein